MRKEHTIRKRLGDPPDRPVDWERLDTMTDEEVQRAALADPDAQPDSDEFFETGAVMTPEEFREFMAGRRKLPGRKN
jgi:hypothetical protein